MTTNGNGDAAAAYRRHFQSAQAYQRRAEEAEQTAASLRAEAERLASLADDWERRRQDFAASAHVAGVPADLRKSRMSPGEISRFIRAHPGGAEAGAAAFLALPR